MNWRFWKPRTIYGCGNCRRTFRSEDALRQHVDDGCPQVEMERELADWNHRAEQTIGDRKAVAEEFSEQ